MNIIKTIQKTVQGLLRTPGIPRNDPQFVRAGLTPTIQQDPSLIAKALAESLSGRMSGQRDIRETLINASRAEDQRNGYYNGMLNRVSRDRVGTGPKLRPGFENDDWNRVIRQRWNEWAIRSKFSRKLRSAVRDAARDGATLGIQYTNERMQGPVKLDVWFSDCLRLRNPYAFESSQKLHADGIDLDLKGNPLNYYVDQNDILDTTGALTIEPPKSYRPEDVIHFFTHRSSEQVHGLPEAASGLLMYPALRRYLTAVIHNAEQAANIVYTVSNENGFQDEYSPDPFATIPIDYNTIQELPAGYRMDAFKAEQPTAQHDELVNSMVNESARCFDMPLILAVGNAGEASFSASNFDIGPYIMSSRLHRQDIACDIVDRVFDWWYQEAMLIEGYLPSVMRRNHGTGNDIPHSWGWDRIFRHADPEKVANSKNVDLKTGATTLIQIYDEEGEDARESLEAEAKMLGLSFEEYAEMLVAARFGSPSPAEQEMAEKQMKQQAKQAEQAAKQSEKQAEQAANQPPAQQSSQPAGAT